METAPTLPKAQPTSQEISTPAQKKSSPFLAILTLLLIVSNIYFVAIAFYPEFRPPFMKQSSGTEKPTPSQTTSKEDTTKREFAQPVEGEYQSFPIVREGTLTLAPIDPTKQPTVINDVDWGTYGIGTNYPITAPNLRMTAYLKKNKLFIASSDGKHTTPILQDITISFIHSWSPDSRYLVVILPQDSVMEHLGGMGQSMQDTFLLHKSPIAGGYYLLDLQSGTKTALPLQNIETWLGPKKVLSFYPYPNNSDTSSAVVDVETFEANRAVLGETFNTYFGTQFSVSRDGKKWALALAPKGKIETENTRIVLADYPKLEGATVAQGPWASVQKPILSPSGTRVVYWERDPGPNTPTNVGYWDGSLSTRLFQGAPVLWVDDNRFIFYEFDTDTSTNADNNLKAVKVFNVTTKDLVTIFERK